MAEQIDEQTVHAIAACARIALTEDEVKTMVAELNSIVESLAPITEYELEGVEPTFHALGGPVNIMREDIPESEFSQDCALANAAQTEKGYFLIPSILGGGE